MSGKRAVRLLLKGDEDIKTYPSYHEGEGPAAQNKTSLNGDPKHFFNEKRGRTANATAGGEAGTTRMPTGTNNLARDLKCGERTRKKRVEAETAHGRGVCTGKVLEDLKVKGKAAPKKLLKTTRKTIYLTKNKSTLTRKIKLEVPPIT